MKLLQTIISAAVVCIMLAFSVSAEDTGYPDPGKTGFHNCALIYERDSRTMEDLRFYVAEPRRGNAPVRWGFDAFLFLTLYHNGQETSYMKSGKALWEMWLDRYFAPGRDIDALDRAIESVGEMPQSKRKVIITLPWMNSEVTDFGDVDGDGISENLSREEDRAKVAAWYIDLARKKFAAGNYRHLEFWGFYWMREDLVRDRKNAKQITAIVHQNNFKIMWIPYYHAPGWDRWKEFGMDLALMQSSYPFRSWIDRGVVRRNRIFAAADAMREAGLGFEVEGRGLETPEERRMFLEILAFGAPDKAGYQNGTQAYFLGFDVVERLARSADPEEQAVYKALMDYLNGKMVVLDQSGQPEQWTIYRSGDGKSVSAEAVLPRKAVVSIADVFFRDAVPEKGWLGYAEAFVKHNPGDKWIPAGWAIAGNQDSYAGERNRYERGFRNVSIPVGGREIYALKIVLTGREREIPAFEISCDFFGPQLTGYEDIALNRSYRTTLTRKNPLYPDSSGGKLTDGTTVSKDYSAYIGWGNEPGHMSILLDNDPRIKFDEIRVHCRGGSHDGVNFPLNPCVVLSDKAPFREMSGMGPIPDPDAVVLDYAELVRTAIQNDYVIDGYLKFPVPGGSNAKYVSFHGESAGWIMISEMEMLGAGKVLSRGARYQVSPFPTAERNNSNEANGVWLTDGAIAKRAWFGQYYGWQGGAPVEITLDLGQERNFSSVTVWSVKDQKYGVVPPKGVEIAFSRDGVSWSAPHPAAQENPSASYGPAPARLNTERISARYVRVRVSGRAESWAWTMLSEIEVK